MWHKCDRCHNSLFFDIHSLSLGFPPYHCHYNCFLYNLCYVWVDYWPSCHSFVCKFSQLCVWEFFSWGWVATCRTGGSGGGWAIIGAAASRIFCNLSIVYDCKRRDRHQIRNGALRRSLAGSNWVARRLYCHTWWLHQNFGAYQQNFIEIKI